MHGAAALLLAVVFFWLGDGADPSMAADFSEPRAASAGSLCVHLLYCIPMLFFSALGALSSSPAPMPWSAPLLHCKKKKKTENKGNKKEQRKEKKNGPGRVEPPSSASQPEWLKKAMPHP